MPKIVTLSHPRTVGSRLRAILLTAALAIVALAATPLIPAAPAQAVTGSQFNPGNIISDQLFYDGRSLTAAEVQTFLNSHVGACRAGYTCLKDYRESTGSKPGGACAAYSGQASESAATIIARVGAACSISPKALIVLLEKEQGLISDTWPTARQYRSATGYGCPDTADCDVNFYGFFNQVYAAARQFQYYKANPGHWNHVAGRVNTVRFSPNAACGSSSVYIENAATAGLYNYTPYQPNPAALANLYGTGDGCSTYGNRNFWRMYTDWFGTAAAETTSSNLLRSPTDPSIFVVSGTTKYHVQTMADLTGLSALGPVGVVSQPYLDRLTTGRPVGRGMRDDTGSIYYLDGGRKHHFSTCEQAQDYGASCALTGYIQLTNALSNLFPNGPDVTGVASAADGRRYQITSLTKKQILDDSSRAAANLTATATPLTDGALATFGTAAPVTRDGVFFTSPTGTWLLTGGLRYPVPEPADSGATTRIAGTLTAESTTLVPAATRSFTGIVSTGNVTTALTGTGRYTLVAGAPKSTVAVPQALIDGYTWRGVVRVGSLIKRESDATAYAVAEKDIRLVPTRAAVTAIGGPVITVPNQIINAFAHGPIALQPGTLVRIPGTTKSWLVNGFRNRIAVPTPSTAKAAGITAITYTSIDRLGSYPLAGTLSYGIVCGAQTYVSAGGAIHPITAGLAPLYPFTYAELEPYTCGRLKTGSAATALIRVPSGVVYWLDAGRKRQVTSGARLTQLKAGGAPLNVDVTFAVTIPTGAKIG